MENETSFDRTIHLIEEAEQTLHAIREGAVDAFVVEDAEGHRVHTLEGSDLPYSSLVEGMHQGAAMLDAKGCIIYANRSLGRLLGLEREELVGTALIDCLATEDLATCQTLISEMHKGAREAEMRLRRSDNTFLFASFSFKSLSRDGSVVGVLVSDLTAHKQLAELAARLQDLQDEERRRIARELHDSVGQLLAAIGMNTGIVQAQTHKLDPIAARAVSDNAMLVEQVSREIRTISHLLHPPLLDMAGLVSAVRWYVDGFSERSKIKVDVDIPADFARLPPEMEIAIFRIVQECLTNIHRHSGSATASIRFYRERDRIVVQIRDYGKGIPAEKQLHLLEGGHSGVGLGGIRERLKNLGGMLEIQSEGTGTVVNAILKVA